MTAITSICLPVTTHPEARHVIIDADRNVIAECGAHFAGLDGTGMMLKQAETIAAELVTVLNTQDDLVNALSDARLVIQALIEEPRMAGVPLDELIHGIDAQLAAARVGVES